MQSGCPRYLCEVSVAFLERFTAGAPGGLRRWTTGLNLTVLTSSPTVGVETTLRKAAGGGGVVHRSCLPGTGCPEERRLTPLPFPLKPQTPYSQGQRKPHSRSAHARAPYRNCWGTASPALSPARSTEALRRKSPPGGPSAPPRFLHAREVTLVTLLWYKGETEARRQAEPCCFAAARLHC